LHWVVRLLSPRRGRRCGFDRMNKAGGATMFGRRVWVRVLRIVSVVFMGAFEKHRHEHRSGYYGLGIVNKDCTSSSISERVNLYST